MNDVWRPNVTVAAIIEEDGRFLLVEEETPEGIRFNQPAGHLDEGESVVSAMVRETLEETAYAVEPLHLVGIYRWRRDGASPTYLRFAFAARVTGHDPAQPLDVGILRAVWYSYADIAGTKARHRSPLVLACVDDFRAGRRYPLELLRDFA